MSTQFRIIDHITPCQHTREYPRATCRGDSDRPRLAVKQYIPLDNPEPRPGDVSIIAAHANGFPKEMYEPLWEEILQRCQQNDFRIRSIWMADVWNQGQSGLLNEELFGNDQNWFDHSRDLLYLINQKQDAIPHPIVAIGHSMGGTQLAHLSLMHPRLLRGLVLIDPVIQRNNPGMVFGAVSARRRDMWPSRKVAEVKFKASKFYQAWDPRVFDRWMTYGLRDTKLPASEATTPEETSVTLVTKKDQELVMFERPTYRGKPGVSPHKDKTNYADLDPNLPSDFPGHPFYRPEAAWVYDHLPEIRPRTLYVFGGESTLEKTKSSGPPDTWKEKVARTGVGVGGGGGVQHGQVESTVVAGAGHLVAFEKVHETAESISDFIGKEMQNWRQDARAFEVTWVKRPQLEKATIDDQWKENVDPRKFDPEAKSMKKSVL